MTSCLEGPCGCVGVWQRDPHQPPRDRQVSKPNAGKPFLQKRHASIPPVRNQQETTATSVSFPTCRTKRVTFRGFRSCLGPAVGCWSIATPPSHPLHLPLLPLSHHQKRGTGRLERPKRWTQSLPNRGNIWRISIEPSPAPPNERRDRGSVVGSVVRRPWKSQSTKRCSGPAPLMNFPREKPRLLNQDLQTHGKPRSLPRVASGSGHSWMCRRFTVIEMGSSRRAVTVAQKVPDAMRSTPAAGAWAEFSGSPCPTSPEGRATGFRGPKINIQARMSALCINMLCCSTSGSRMTLSIPGQLVLIASCC